MTPEIQAVLRLQSLDLRAASLKKEIEALPKQVAQIEKKLEAHLRRLEADRNSLAANQKARKQLDDDIKVQQQKMSKLRDQMLQAKTNEQYKAFQNEIGYCEQVIRTAEDRTLELMTESEPLDQAVKAAEASLKQEKLEVEVEQERARKRGAEDQEFLRQALQEREQVASSLDKKLLAHYERIRKRWNSTAVAEAVNQRCSACHMSLRPQFFQDLKQSDKIHFCESCGRILYYNPPVSMEHELHQKATRPSMWRRGPSAKCSKSRPYLQGPEAPSPSLAISRSTSIFRRC